jgi:3-hydroxy-9,10-secoandrosta-1,3,5(10)-triene-9,17-dione monooxygenase
VAGIIGVRPWQTALYSDETQQEIWGDDPTTMNSSSYAPTGKAERVPGGFRLSGRWSFSSGCDHCRWVNLGTIAGGIDVDRRQLPDFRSFLLPRKDYRIDDNWHVAGLAGTGSKDIVVNDAFVPDHRSMSHWDLTLGKPMPGWELNPAPLCRPGPRIQRRQPGWCAKSFSAERSAGIVSRVHSTNALNRVALTAVACAPRRPHGSSERNKRE